MLNKTVVIVAHRLSTVRAANVVFVISGGTVVGKGTHDELLQNNELYSNLVRRQLLSAATMTAELVGTASTPPAGLLEADQPQTRRDGGADNEEEEDDLQGDDEDVADNSDDEQPDTDASNQGFASARARGAAGVGLAPVAEDEEAGLLSRAALATKPR